MTNLSEFTFLSSDGKTQLHGMLWEPEGMAVRAVLQICHGVAEHIARYDGFARALNEQGIVVAGHDHLGHGKSLPEDGTPVYFGEGNTWNTVVDDIYVLHQRLKQRYPDVPLCIMGHSMGSFLTRTYLIRYPGTVKAAVIMGTGWQPQAAITGGLALANAIAAVSGENATSELVTELLQYLVEPTDLLREEAGALLAGIVLDTKHFTQRTGGRTFEAAAFLRRSGADTAEVQRLFQGDLKDMVTKYDIIRRAEMYRSNIAVSVVEEPGVDRVAAAQAADDLLTLKGVQASFVVYAAEGAVLMSARSLGEINVQVILEALGGGGNSTTAGARIEDTDPESVRQQLIGVLDAYFEK